MRKKFLYDISASFLQVFINQLAGLIIFYISSRYLDKASFGEINWSLAVLMTSFNIIGCGIEQVVVKKVAAGDKASSILSLYIGHVVMSGGLFFISVMLASFLFPTFFTHHSFLTYLAISQLFYYFSFPFKQVATGKEKFRVLMLMSVCSNIIKAIGLVVLTLVYEVNALTFVGVFIASTFLELLLCIYLTAATMRISLKLQWSRNKYVGLIRESLPMLGVVIFNSAVARFDWILLGLLSTATVLAEYSFAYKVYELSTLPLLIVAPLLLPRFTRLFRDERTEDATKKTDIFLLIRLEMIISCVIVLVINMVWAPVIDAVTQNKYGQVNVYNILFLTSCMPFLYLNNLLWTINFSQGRLSAIFSIITFTFLLNVVGDIALIPFFGGKGAAVAYLVAICSQTVFYMRRTSLSYISGAWNVLLLAIGCTVASGLVARWLFSNPWLAVTVAVLIYSTLLCLTRLIRISDWPTFKRVINI